MTDVLPVVFIGADEDLAIQLVGRHGKWGHVRRELEERGHAFDADETEAAGERRWRSVFVRGGEDEAPLAEGRDVNVIGIRLQAGLFEGLRDAPEGVASKHRRCALNDHESLRTEVAGGGTIERGGVKLAEGIVRGVRKIDDDEIETVGVRINPREGVGVDDMNARGEEGFVVELGEHGMRGEESGHLGVEINEGDAFDLWIFQDFADSETVATAKDENVSWCGYSSKTGMDESFVIAVFIARTELQVTVEEKAEIIFEASEDEMLVASVAGVDDVVGVDVVFGGGGDFFRFGDADAEGD